MTFCHILRATSILQENDRGMRGERDKQALVIRTNCVSCRQGAMSAIGCPSLSRERGGGISNEGNGRINMRVTQHERDYIREQAEASGLSVSEYVRRRVLSRRVVSRTDKKMLSELRRQGGLLKYVFKESRGMYSEKTAIALENMNVLIEGLESMVLNDSENSARTQRQEK